MLETGTETGPAPSYASHGYRVLRGVIDPGSMKLLSTYALLCTNQADYFKPEPKLTAVARYADPLAESILLHVQPAVERTTGLKLYPSYSYLRIYGPLAELPRHVDRPSCEVSATLTIGGDAQRIWPIHVHSGEQEFAIELAPGDMMVYSGCTVPHWRETFDGEYWVQAFLHYVDVAGEQTMYRFDRRDGIGMARNPFPPPGEPLVDNAEVRAVLGKLPAGAQCPCRSGRLFEECHGRRN